MMTDVILGTLKEIAEIVCIAEGGGGHVKDL